MRTTKFLTTSILLVTALVFVNACKKSNPKVEQNKAVEMMQQKILGRWNLIKFIEETKKGNEPAEVIENKPKDIYFEFFANGKVKTNAEGEEEHSYSVKADNTLILNDFPQTITELTGSTFTFGNTAIEAGTIYKQTYVLTR